MAIRTTTVTMPASWASALVNDDWTGLMDEELEAAAIAWDWLVEDYGPDLDIDVQRDEEGEPVEPWFSWNADVQGSTWQGANLLRYTTTYYTGE